MNYHKLDKLDSEIEKLYEINPNDPRIEELEAQANALADEISEYENQKKVREEREDVERREKAIENRLKKKFGDKWKDWYDWAKSLYPTTSNGRSWTVTSKAREWKEEKSKVFYSEIEAKEYIEKLIDQKENDRKRGHASGKNDMIENIQQGDTCRS